MVEFEKRIVEQLNIMNDNGDVVVEQLIQLNCNLEKLYNKLDEVKTQPIKKDKNV